MSVKEYITKINETGNSYLAEVKEHACSAALTDPQQCVDFINQAFDAAHLSEEHFYVIATDTKSKPIAVFDVAHGVIDGAYVQPEKFSCAYFYAALPLQFYYTITHRVVQISAKMI